MKSDITLVTVAGVRATEAEAALKESMHLFPCGKAKLITSCDFTPNYSGYDLHKVGPMDYAEYNRFIVYELHKYIETKYALIIQDDGFVRNPHLWSDEFYDYDYIGAVWPEPKDDFSYRDPFGNLVRVGNGGFSFRSKWLLQLASHIGLEWKQYYGFWNEDGFICCHNRHFYEVYGCKFAPVDVAQKFSTEWVGDGNSFGFHGKHLCNR